MKICFIGNSHAAKHLSQAAVNRGFELCDLDKADLTFVSQDTPTTAEGVRDLDVIRSLVKQARRGSAPIVLTSAVPPGFTRSLGFELWHQAETLRMRDAERRANRPEMLIVGFKDPHVRVPDPYYQYLKSFGCPILRVTWEEAEFAKVAINCMLAVQVSATNIMAAAAMRCGAHWEVVADILRHDKRIGMHAYLSPGRWEDSPHLMRDMRTLEELSK